MARVDEVSRLAAELRLACMRISRRVRFESTDVLAPHQFSVLARLEERARSAGELAELERVSAPSMTRTVAALVERGLITRSANPADGRIVILTLSEAGASVLRQVREAREEWMVSRIGQLSRRDRELLERAAVLLHRVAEQ